jgi:hypothetical protein
MKTQESKSYDVISYNRFGYRICVASAVSYREASRILEKMGDFYSRLTIELIVEEIKI